MFVIGLNNNDISVTLTQDAVKDVNINLKNLDEDYVVAFFKEDVNTGKKELVIDKDLLKIFGITVKYESLY